MLRRERLFLQHLQLVTQALRVDLVTGVPLQQFVESLALDFADVLAQLGYTVVEFLEIYSLAGLTS